MASYNTYGTLCTLNLNLSVVKNNIPDYQINIISVDEKHAYCTSHSNKLRIYNQDLVSIKIIGQNDVPTEPFYFPTDIKQFECKNGKYFWLDNTNLQILREDNGVLIKSLKVTADNFSFNSNENIVLLNKATKELNYFSKEGAFIESIPIENYHDGLTLMSLKKNDEPIFFDKKST